jgi:hypothetical protein
LQRRRGDEAFFIGVLIGRPGDQEQERKRRRGGDQVEPGPQRRACGADQGVHPHVLGATKGHRSAEHRQPQKQHRGELVGPDQRAVQAVTGDHAGEQDHDLRNHQNGGRDFHQQRQRGFKRWPERARARGRHRRHAGSLWR